MLVEGVTCLAIMMMMMMMIIIIVSEGNPTLHFNLKSKYM